MNVSAERPPRRTQRERREAMRAALLDAALDCLVEEGYAGTTTGRVCERAGVSRGAHLHHFGTRATLVAAALEELARRRGAVSEEQARALPAGDHRIERALDLVWSWYTGPLFQAAARTDPELRAGLAPVERELGRHTLHLCREMFAGDRTDASMDRLIGMALATVRGLALLPVLQPGARSVDEQWSFARGRLAAAFRAAA
jgi:AcrR family transcriptional regulator